MAEREWYYAQGNRQEGPISERGLIELLAVGKLPLTTLVWCEEMSNWSPASTVDVFRALGAATQPIAAPQQQPQQYAPAPNSPPPLNIVQQQSYNPPQPV